jgi:glycosyltransferase involved in cell wall biosynthesis
MREKVELRIIGSTFEEDSYKANILDLVASLGLSDCIRFDPFNPDPVDFYHWSDVLVVPSRVIESFGLVAIEAMAYGKSVVAAAQGGIREIVIDGETGWLFPAGDVAMLAACLAEAINRPTAVVERGHKGYHRFMERFHASYASRAFEGVIISASRRVRGRRVT